MREAQALDGTVPARVVCQRMLAAFTPNHNDAKRLAYSVVREGCVNSLMLWLLTSMEKVRFLHTVLLDIGDQYS